MANLDAVTKVSSLFPVNLFLRAASGILCKVGLCFSGHLSCSIHTYESALVFELISCFSLSLSCCSTKSQCKTQPAKVKQQVYVCMYACRLTATNVQLMYGNGGGGVGGRGCGSNCGHKVKLLCPALTKGGQRCLTLPDFCKKNFFFSCMVVIIHIYQVFLTFAHCCMFCHILSAHSLIFSHHILSAYRLIFACK